MESAIDCIIKQSRHILKANKVALFMVNQVNFSIKEIRGEMERLINL